jgi:prephenate dehydrogenase
LEKHDRRLAQSLEPFVQDPTSTGRPTLGLIGYGAFGALAARHLSRLCDVRLYDPRLAPGGTTDGLAVVTLAEAAGADIVVLAPPVDRLEAVIGEVAPHVKRGALVLDVASVKAAPSQWLLAGLPHHVDIVATHPLFGPQSAANGTAGLKIVLCPLRGPRVYEIAAILRRAFGLHVIVTTPEQHDREAAVTQGLTHFLAKIMGGIGPLPTRVTARSFDLLMHAIGMVADDAPAVYDAIQRRNPYTANVRRRFLELAEAADADLVT